jgi:hypothetical protein
MIKRLGLGMLIGVALYFLFFTCPCHAGGKPSPKAKFYNFNEQIIDGEIRTPSFTYFDHRQRVKFERLLRLKKSFLPKLFATSKEKIFK